MRDWLTLLLTCLALLHSVAGRLPVRHVAHEHVLIGHVTLQELQAHEAAEELDGPATNASARSEPTLQGGVHLQGGVRLQGGVIISLLYGSDDSSIPMLVNAIAAIFLALVSVIWHPIFFPRWPTRRARLIPLEHPPRLPHAFC